MEWISESKALLSVLCILYNRMLQSSLHIPTSTSLYILHTWQIPNFDRFPSHPFNFNTTFTCKILGPNTILQIFSTIIISKAYFSILKYQIVLKINRQYFTQLLLPNVNRNIQEHCNEVYTLVYNNSSN